MIGSRKFAAGGFKPRIVREADGAPSALAFVARIWGGGCQPAAAEDVIFRALAPEDSAWVPVGAAWKPDPRNKSSLPEVKGRKK